MTQPIKDSPQPGQVPSCPHCGETLRLKGTVEDTGKYKKWVERWHCATHGEVRMPDEESLD